MQTVSPSPATQPADRYFAIHVVDAETGRGVPLVELTTTSNVRLVTDSNGYVAFDEPGLMEGKEVWFTIDSHGYEVPADGFGSRGVRLKPTAGESATVEIERKNIAERLYRVTGQGIYGDTVRLGLPTPIERPVINGLVTGQDSVQSVVYDGKLYWFWGDTGRPAYPLGNFEMSGATSALPEDGGLSPAVGVNLEYFVNEDGFSRPMAPLPGPGPVWLDALMVVPDESGRERLLAHYSLMKSLGERLEQGLMLWNDEKAIFEKLKTLDLDATRVPGGHPVRVERDGQAYFYFPQPYPFVRSKADWANVTDPAAYEAFTPIASGETFAGAKTTLDRDENGEVVWSWKSDAEPLTPAQQKELVDAGVIERAESPFRLADAATGRPVQLHASSVAWNDYRDCWILIGVEIGGESSTLGEVWYAEADAPEGPWSSARKIVTHDDYSFYNPRHHPMLDEAGGRFIYFEGTYTALFSGSQPTPRYDYNQVMYRLDLADERLRP